MIDLSDLFAVARAEAEERLVACISSNPDRIAEVSQVIDWSELVNPFFAAWYRLAVDLFDAGTFSQDRLRAQLRHAGYLRDPGETALFAQLCREPMSGADAIWHASELARMVAAQKVKQELEVALLAFTDQAVNPETLIANLIPRLESIGCKQSDLWEHIDLVADRVYENHRANCEEQRELGIPTGFPSIDAITGGLFAGQLWQIAARSYMGKSTVALAFAYQQVVAGRGCYFASYEMTNDELMERMLSDRTGIPLYKFTKGGVETYELKRVDTAVGELKGLPMFMDDRPPASVTQLKARVKLARNSHPVSLVVVDHLGLFPHTDRRVPRYQQLVELTRELKAMAKDLGLTVLLLNQLNADADGEKPTDKNYSDSKGILANLDVSILLHRESKTAEDMNCNVTKNRKGKPEECTLRFEGEIQRLSDPYFVPATGEPFKF